MKTRTLIPVLLLCLSVFCFGQNPSAGKSFGPLLWKYQTSGKIFSSPLLYKDLVVAGSEDKTLYALNAGTGKMVWKFTTGGALHGSPVAAGDRIFFVSYDGYCYALDGRTGKLHWKFRTNGEKKVGRKGLWTMKPADQYMDDPYDFFLSSPAVDTTAGLVYFGSSDGNLYALRMTDGKLQWHFQTGGIIHSSPVLYKNTLFFGSWDRYLYAVDSRTGKEKWKFQTRADTTIHLLEGIQASPLIYDDQIFFGARDGYCYALDLATGELKWKYSANNSWILTTAAAADGTVYTGTSDTYLLLALDAATGREKFRVKANGYVYSSPVIDGNTIYFGDFTGQLFAVNRFSGEILGRFETPGRKKSAAILLNKGDLDFAYLTKGMDLAYYATTVAGIDKLYTLGPILSKPAIANGIIYFGSADGCIYATKLIH
ncbi:MAG TPA: PQQ-binding-like beta-propeller repeat protein [Puia sp.]|nr:PQQ-binding-like beta-propeller repeat protein [Puia sp.]